MIPGFSGSRLAYFFDVDGTLIDIAARPDDVVVPPSLLAALARLAAANDGAVALVSGRTIEDIDGLFRPLKLRASGVHGAEVRFEPDASVVLLADNLLPPSVIDAVRSAASAVPGTLVEDKRFSVALHYRQNPDAGFGLREALNAIAAAHPADGLRILPGHMVFEIKRATFDKGMAIGRFMKRAPFAGRVPVFLGDDVTDRPGFEEVLRAGGFALSVGQPFSGLSGSFSDPAAVRRWLSELAASETSQV